MNATMQKLLQKQEFEQKHFIPEDDSSAEHLRETHLAELISCNKKISKSNTDVDPTYIYEENYPTANNKQEITAYVHKSDLEDGLSIESPVWLHTQRFTLYRGELIGNERGTNTMVYEKFEDISSVNAHNNFDEHFVKLSVTMVNDDLKPSCKMAHHFVIKNFSQISDSLKPEYDNTMAKYPDYIQQMGRNIVQPYGRLPSINNPNVIVLQTRIPPPPPLTEQADMEPTTTTTTTKDSSLSTSKGFKPSEITYIKNEFYKASTSKERAATNKKTLPEFMDITTSSDDEEKNKAPTTTMSQVSQPMELNSSEDECSFIDEYAL